MVEKTLINYSYLLNDYRKIQEQKADISTEPLTIRYTTLLENYTKLLKERREVARSFAPEFNIFRLLSVSGYESTHSRILADLLDPKGTHGQGALFLRSFFEVCHKKSPESIPIHSILEPGICEKSVVLGEYHTSQGRVDLVIINSSIGFLGIIENKITASEQPDQLKRYLTWLESKGKEFQSRCLIFLTITGHLSVTADPKEYIPLSYDRDICPWLNRMLPSIQAVGVSTILLHYIEIAKLLRFDYEGN